MKKKNHLATDHGNLRLSQTQINNRVETNELHSYESMHVIVESCFAALLLSVLINFDNEIIIFEKTKTKKLFYGTTNLNLRQKHCRSRQSNLFTQFLRKAWMLIKKPTSKACPAGNVDFRSFVQQKSPSKRRKCRAESWPRTTHQIDTKAAENSKHCAAKNLCDVLWFEFRYKFERAAFQPHQRICEFTRSFRLITASETFISAAIWRSS